MTCRCDPEQVDGYPYTEWIGRYFGDCLYTPWDHISFAFGLLSLFFYFISMMPQWISNYKRKSTDGLSLRFIMIWFLGDMANVMGALFTQQLPTMIYTGSYFVLSDLLSLSQFAYYGFVNRRKRPITDEETRLLDSENSGNNGSSSKLVNLPIESADSCAGTKAPNSDEDSDSESTGNGVQHGNGARQISSLSMPFSNSTSVIIASIAFLTISSFVECVDTALNNADSPLPLCDAKVPLQSATEILGSVLAWISGLLYFTSRIPQLLENFKRQSVEGLSIALFILTVSANLCYGLAILMRFPTIDTKFWTSTFPYLIGSMGTLLMDIGIILQSIFYR